jgi:4-hydroxy-tetrahydrodipicolinate synthase
MHEAWQRGDAREALTIHLRLTPLHKALFLETSPAPVKYAVARLGKCAPDVRLPLVAPKESTRERVDAAMVAAGLIN